jgi:hypothetical protein
MSAGSGLGKAGQGRLEPVGLSKQRGRRGLGLVIQARPLSFGDIIFPIVVLKSSKRREHL